MFFFYAFSSNTSMLLDVLWKHTTRTADETCVRNRYIYISIECVSTLAFFVYINARERHTDALDELAGFRVARLSIYIIYNIYDQFIDTFRRVENF